MPPVVYRRVWLSALYWCFALVFLLLGLLLLAAALGRASGPESRSEKSVGVIGFSLAGLSWLFGIYAVAKQALSYGRNLVRLTADSFYLRTPSGMELEFPIATVRAVSWDASLRARLCTVDTDAGLRRFDAAACPRAARIARQLAALAAVPLTHASGARRYTPPPP